MVTIGEIEELPAHLLKRGYWNGKLTISVLFSRKKVVLKKYIYSPKRYGIELHFPKVRWSAKYYQELLDYCRKEKSNFRILTDKGIDFLCVDFGKDSAMAYVFLRLIILKIFNLNKDKKLSFLLENASLKDELINDP